MLVKNSEEVRRRRGKSEVLKGKSSCMGGVWIFSETTKMPDNIVYMLYVRILHEFGLMINLLN